MRAAVLYSPGDTRCVEVDEPTILEPTDAIIRLSAFCICWSDLWPYRGLQPVTEPADMGHEYCGVVVEVGSAVTTGRPGEFVVGSFVLSYGRCPNCPGGWPSSCAVRQLMSGGQAPIARNPNADGTLVATAEMPPEDLIPSLLAASDVLGTGWYAADAARVQPGGSIGFVGVPHGVSLDGQMLFFAQKNLLGGPAPELRYLPHRKMDPGKVFDLELPLEDVAEGYKAMDDRRAIKTLLRF